MPDSLKVNLDDLEVLTVPESAWLNAIMKADTWRDATWAESSDTLPSPNTAELVRQLRQRLKPTATIISLSSLEVELLADLLARHSLKPKPGGRRVPMYRQSWAELKIRTANEMVDELISEGTKPADAVIEISEQTEISEGQLANFRAGKRGGSRRKKALRPPT